ncbi:hypothetical protein JOM56_002715 [Amanita muscaria]
MTKLFLKRPTLASVMAIHPHLGGRTVAPECTSKCNATYTKYQQYLSGTCGLPCICVPSTIDDASACYTCLTAAGSDPTPLSPDLIQQTVQDCAAAGYPIAGAPTVSGVFGSATDFPLSGCTTLPSINGGFPPFSTPSKAAVKNTGVAVASGRLGVLIAVATTCFVGLTV